MSKTPIIEDDPKIVTPESLVEIPESQPDELPLKPSRSAPVLPTGTGDPTIKNK